MSARYADCSVPASVRTSPGVRLLPPSSVTGPGWLAENIVRHRRFTLSDPAVLLLIGCSREQPMAEAVSRVARSLSLEEDEVDAVADELCRLELLIAPERIATDPDLCRALGVREEWDRHGWTEAAEYHVASWDYPFYGGSEEGLATARGIMQTYSGTEPDVQRIKTYPDARVRISLPSPVESAAKLALGTCGHDGSALDLYRLGILASLAFGRTRSADPRWTGEPLMFRTSPSGGSRHPTEAYLCAAGVADLEPAWYHIAIDPPCLEHIVEGPPDEMDVHRQCPVLARDAPFETRAVLVLTSVFERNMYRYREPRTFRTVHMDAGHLTATVEALAGVLGVKTFVRYGADEHAIERRLGLAYLQEGVQVCIALG